MNDPLIEALHEHEPLSDPLEELNLRMAIAASDIAELRAEVARLDRDLDESRRLNLRAAELLDLVYEHLADRPSGAGTLDGAKRALQGEGAGI
jgi:chromosome segregation ATPase